MRGGLLGWQCGLSCRHFRRRDGPIHLRELAWWRARSRWGRVSAICGVLGAVTWLALALALVGCEVELLIQIAHWVFGEALVFSAAAALQTAVGSARTERLRVRRVVCVGIVA